MDCETATPLIEALCDDELDVATAARLVAHLDTCAACAALKRDTETRNASLREAHGTDRLPTEVRARLVREMARSAAPRRAGSGRVALGVAAAAVVAAGLVAGLARRRAESEPPVPRGAAVVREVTGEVFCLRCALLRLFPDTPVLDPGHLPILRTTEGEVITLLDGAVTRAALARKGCAGRRVALTLRLFPEQELAEVLAVRAVGPDPTLPARDSVAAEASRASGPRR